MEELEQLWPKLLDAAAQKAVAEGRNDVADFLRLKAANDAIRTTASDWLVDILVELASPHLSTNSRLKIDLIQPCSFRIGHSTMVGRGAELSHGIRKLTVSTGWPRLPEHGILRGGALAHARFVHFGMAAAGTELRLINDDGSPKWLDENGTVATIQLVNDQLKTLLS